MPIALAGLELLAAAGETLGASLDWDETVRAVARVAVPVFADFAFFDVIVGEAVRREVASPGAPERQALLDQTRWAHAGVDSDACALSSGKAHVHPEVDEAWLAARAVSPDHLALLRRVGFRSLATVPVAHRGKLLGAITLCYAESGRRYGPGDLEVLERLALRAAIAVENARRFREAEDATAVRDRFLAIASHELKTPLTTLLLQVENMLRGTRETLSYEKIVRRAEIMKAQLVRLDRLVNELLDVSRIAAGKIPLRPEPVELAELVRDVVARFAEEAREAGSPLQLQTGGGRVIGRWDRLRLDQVVTNLLTNAIKYGAGQPIEVTVGRSGKRAHVEVRDHGIGVAPADHARIFQRFVRVGPDEAQGGLGLGLWISDQIVTAMGGRIGLESERGKGACFRLELPL